MTDAERELLQAVLEALTLPYGAGDYDRRLRERAGWARTTLKGVLEDGDPAWHADYLRRKMRDEEAGR
ncbi:hypothetical protein [Streptomyces sp. NPDC001435]|uniref:hypothetical protein n=1 Tax=Streptomyces sp. NPDC001435 TaxID=3364576 RepID=UPI0036CB8025